MFLSVLTTDFPAAVKGAFRIDFTAESTTLSTFLPSFKSALLLPPSISSSSSSLTEVSLLPTSSLYTGSFI